MITVIRFAHVVGGNQDGHLLPSGETDQNIPELPTADWIHS